MTIPSTPRKAGPLLGTGAQTTWPFTFKVFATSDIAVTIANDLGVETALVLNTDYSVTLNSNQETSPGGTVTYPLSGSALPTGSKLTILGNLPYDQPLDLPSGGNFSPLALENELDRLTMQIQQLREQVDRSLQVSVTTGASVALPPPVANELIGWDSTANSLQNFAVSELATAVAYATMKYDTFTGNGTTTQFTLTADPVTLANLDVAISGVTQVPGSDYSLLNGILVFASAPANGTEILARYGEGLINVGGDSSDIRFLQAGTGAVATNVQAKLRETVSVFDYMTATQISDVEAGTLSVDVTAAVQAAIDASYGRRLHLPRGRYKLTSALTIQPVFGGFSQLPMTISGDGFDANGGNGGTALHIQHTGNGITINNATAGNADARFILEGFSIIGDGVNAAGGDGIYAVKVSNLTVRDVWVQDMRNRGIYFERCYGSSLQDLVLLRNRVWGFYANQAWNLGHMLRVRAYSNGRIYSNGVCGNIRITGSGDENLGVIVDDVDVSYSGSAAFSLFERSNSTLTNIVVSTGVATVTTATAHGLLTGQVISVVGASVSPSLNTVYPAGVTVTGANTFTFVTTAANGTYTDAGLKIGPGAYGFFVDTTRGLVLKGYAEDCIGPALYMGANVRSFDVVGGYWQGAALGCVIINDSAVNGRYRCMYLNGLQAKLQIGVPVGPHNVDVSRDITLNSGATVVLPTLLYRQDGAYYGIAAPTTGTWERGAYVKQSTPSVGAPKGWYCTVAGTPGTWVSEGNL